MMSAYKCLQKQIFQSSVFSLVPLREEDKYEIMRWRNEQIYHLRQEKPLTPKNQDLYFQNTVSKLFEKDYWGMRTRINVITDYSENMQD